MPPAHPHNDAHVVFEDVCMAYGDRPVFDHLSVGFPRARISVILGGSGSGKSTVLRLVGGLIHPTRGRILVDGNDITALAERQLYEVRGKLGMLFQGGALLDSLTVFENLAFPLCERTRLSASQIADQVHDCLAAVGLHDIDGLLPGQLSGGMTKRVALARAIIMKPVILLCDEPFSGLDPISARRIESLLAEINARFGITMLIVSHDIASTMRLAAKVLVLLPDGAVEGTPAEVQQSTDVRVASFLNPEVDESALNGAGDVEVGPAGAAVW